MNVSLENLYMDVFSVINFSKFKKFISALTMWNCSSVKLVFGIKINLVSPSLGNSMKTLIISVLEELQ